MKKMIMTLMLAIAGSVWTMSEGASCLTQALSNLYFPEGSRWANASSEASYIIQGDTLVNGKKYHKVINKNKDRQKLVALKREEGKKIYVRFEGTDTDVLLYDFGLEVGDSIIQHTKEYGFSWCEGPCTYHVERIDTVTLLDGRKARAIYYDGRMRDIEFVGCETGLFGPITMPDIPTMYSSDSYSYCFSINGKPIYETYPEICKNCGFTDKLSYLCDEWNVWYEGFESYGPINFNHLIKYQLTTDTIINEQRYVKLVSDEEYSPYRGALREGNNRDIYCIPAGSTHEYLLYAFNAKVGDRLTNMYLGDLGEETGYDGVVESISDGLPRVFTLRIAYPMEENMESGDSFLVRWIEGVGSSETPMGMAAVPSMTVAADVGVYTLLCAYKNGEQVYTSEMGQKYGCYYDGNAPQTDTIPLFIKDGPGSSTVQPVDPNEIVAMLQVDVLSIFEYIGKEIGYKLSQTSSGNTPIIKRLVKSDTFHESVAVTLTESGTYMLELTHPDWDYTIVGTFEYMGGENAVINTEATEPSARRIMRDGQLLIRKGDKIYTLTGVQIQ